MITGGFGMSVFIGDDGHPRGRKWYVRADGVRRWADNDQPCEPQSSSKPTCAINGVLHGGHALCGAASVGSNPKGCNSVKPCQHQREGK